VILPETIGQCVAKKIPVEELEGMFTAGIAAVEALA
jgi:hypothetical protein